MTDLVDTAAVWLAQGLLAAGRQSRSDGWSNTTTGMGTWRDKTRGTFYAGSCDLQSQELEDLYANDDVAGRGVDLVPEECFRPGFHLEDEAQQKDFAKESKRLGLTERLVEADCFGRLHGGALLVFGKEDGQSASAPLKITKDRATDWVDVIDNRYFSVLKYYDRGPKTNQPELYTIGSPGPRPQGGFVIHESRTIWFGGERTTRTEKLRRGWRDHSVLQRPYDVIRKFATGFESIGQLLSDGPQGVFSIDGLRDLISVHGTAAIEARVELIDRMRSVVRGMVVDGKGEKFERQQVPFAGIPDVMDRLALRLAAALREPMVLLFGMSPSGFSTGDTDIRIWTNRCRARQNTYLDPRIEQAARVILGLPLDTSPAPGAGEERETSEGSEIEICWGNLWEETRSEAADSTLKETQAEKLDFDMGVREPEEIFLDREGRPGWHPSEEAVETREKTVELAQEKLIHDAENPPDPAALPGVPGAPPAPGARPIPGAAVQPRNAGAKPGAARPPAAR